MPIKIPDNLPAKKILENENIFVMTKLRAETQDIRPLKILLVNLMLPRYKQKLSLQEFLAILLFK